MFEHAQTCSNLLKFGLIYSDLLKPTLIYTNLLKDANLIGLLKLPESGAAFSSRQALQSLKFHLV